ncbi:MULTISPECIES: hypothetical protein, partial [unclassified Microcoleus]
MKLARARNASRINAFAQTNAACVNRSAIALATPSAYIGSADRKMSNLPLNNKLRYTLHRRSNVSYCSYCRVRQARISGWPTLNFLPDAPG